MSEPAPGPDDNPEALCEHISLNEAYSCQCGFPLVVCEKHLINEKAGRRFFCICPKCHWGFEIISTLVVNLVKPAIPKGACVFNLTPHNCGHWQRPRTKKDKKRKKR